MNRYPAKPMMDQMAQHGRYGDTMLVHMNPVEVAGIAALSPTGKLTTNPVTGQPEAFLPLLFGALGGALKLGTLGTAALSGIGTAAVTGDLKRGLLAGVTSGLTAGIGEAFAGADAAADVATTGSEGLQSVVDSGGDIMGAIGAGEVPASAMTAAGQAGVGAGTETLSALQAGAYGVDGTGNIVSASAPYDAMLTGSAQSAANPGLTIADVRQLSSAPTSIAGTPADPTISQQLFGGAEDFVNRGIGSLGTSGQLVGAMTTEGVSQQMQTQQDFERQQRAMREESEAKRMQAYDDLQGAYAMAQPGAQRGYSPYRSMMSRNTPPPFVPGMNEGGVVPTAEEQRVLDIAGRGDILGAENQAVLQSYYNRLSEANQAADEADAAADAEAYAADNTLYIEEGATNQEALQALKGAGLVPTDAYNWLMRHYRETGSGDSQYLASESFPGVNEYLSQNDFGKQGDAYIRQILPLIQQGATTGIPLTGGAGSVEDIVAYSPFGGTYYGAGRNPGYGGLDPVTVQKNLRGGVSVAPPRDYMPGFEPEFSYFQEDPSRIDIPSRAFRPTARRFFNYGEGYFDPIMEEQAYLDQLAEYYTKLGDYSPAPVSDVTQPEPSDDDPDTIGDDVTGGPAGTGEELTREALNSMYQELFGRDALDAGFNYWASEVASGNVSLDRLKEALIAGAQGSDRDYYTEKFGSTVAGDGAEDEAEDDTTPQLSPYEARIQELMTNRGMTREQAVANQATAINQGADLNSDGAVTNNEYAIYQGADLNNDGTVTDEEYATFTGQGDSAPSANYYSAADARDTDPFLWSNRASFYGEEVLAGSREEVSGEAFNKALSSQTGRYGGRMIFDPETGTIYEGITDDMSEEEKNGFMRALERAEERKSVPIGVDPKLLSPSQRTRARAMRASGDTVTRIGNTKYLVDNDGNVATYKVRDIDYNFTPGFSLGMNEGGTVPLRTSMGEAEVMAGGIANVPTEFTKSMPSEREFGMVAAAVLGRVENPDVIVDMFVEKYGPEMFRQVRDFVLQNVAPNAQTEGMIRGNGSGMDDKVPGMIGDQQPVAVSPGEFIVPADVVSGLGDGSSDAGAEELDKMMDRVRMSRNGTTKQAPSIEARKAMPA